MCDEDKNTLTSVATATRRRDLYLQSLSEDLRERENNIARQMVTENASAKSKLGKIYLLANELLEVAAPHVACGRGCSSCCKMNVTISSVEADRISNATGWKPAQLTSSKNHPEEAFAGIACPFLVDNTCSIYENRPLVCRTHVAFDASSYWCDPNRMHQQEMPMVRFSGLQEALGKISTGRNGAVYADIRDFFQRSKS